MGSVSGTLHWSENGGTLPEQRLKDMKSANTDLLPNMVDGGSEGDPGKYGKAYNVTGNIGLKLFLKNGKIILLGTQRAQAISYAMEKTYGQEYCS